MSTDCQIDRLERIGCSLIAANLVGIQSRRQDALKLVFMHRLTCLLFGGCTHYLDLGIWQPVEVAGSDPPRRQEYQRKSEDLSAYTRCRPR